MREILSEKRPILCVHRLELREIGQVDEAVDNVGAGESGGIQRFGMRASTSLVCAAASPAFSDVFPRTPERYRRLPARTAWLSGSVVCAPTACRGADDATNVISTA